MMVLQNKAAEKQQAKKNGMKLSEKCNVPAQW